VRINVVMRFAMDMLLCHNHCRIEGETGEDVPVGICERPRLLYHMIMNLLMTAIGRERVGV